MGASLPAGPSWFTDEFKLGVGGSLGVGIPVGGQAELLPSIGAYSFFIDEEEIVGNSSASVSGGTILAIPVTLGLKVGFSGDGPVGGYFVFGGGYYRLNFEDLTINTGRGSVTGTVEGQNNFGGYVGMGLLFRSASGTAFFLEPNFHGMIPTEDIGGESDAVRFFALKLGIAFEG